VTHEIYRLLVTGGSGETGTALLEYLASTDYTVRALTDRVEEELPLRHRGADEVIVGDVFDPDDAAAAMQDVDAVLCAIETGGLRRFLRRRREEAGVRALVDAAAEAGVSYFVQQSALGVGDSRSSLSVWKRALSYRSRAARNASERYLRDSTLPYTILRPGSLVDGERTYDVVVTEGGETVAGVVRRADVAWLMVAALTTPEARNRTFEVVGAETVPETVDGDMHFEWRGPEDGLIAMRSDYTIPS
jgi:uncharacterized protein YbjT (DUF2867 family)